MFETLLFSLLMLILVIQTNTAAFTTPTFVSSTNTSLAWPTDTFKPSTPKVTVTRTDRPLLIAPKYKWDALPTLIKNDPYLKGWNDTIFGNASTYYPLPPVVYFMDGDSGILDNAREIKMRIKAFAYVYRMTNDTKWVDRAWTELQVNIPSSLNDFFDINRAFPIRMQPETAPPPSAPIQINGILPISSIPQNFALLSVSHTIGCTICGRMIRRPLSDGHSLNTVSR